MGKDEKKRKDGPIYCRETGRRSEYSVLVVDLSLYNYFYVGTLYSVHVIIIRWNTYYFFQCYMLYVANFKLELSKIVA